MIAGIQNLCLVVGKWACFELDIMHAAELELDREIYDVLGTHMQARAMGYVDETCTVGDAGGFMASLVGRGTRWICLKAGTGKDSAGRPYDLPLDYQLKLGEHDIHRYELNDAPEPGKKTSEGHFFYAGPGPLWDSCGESNTRKNGHLVSRRILRKLA